ncbi:MAG: NUDIX domain-containing protein [bacterium]
MNKSYGIICFNDKDEMLIVRRKISYAYDSIIRGKYNDIYTFLRYIRLMTEEEKNLLVSKSFQNQWRNIVPKDFFTYHRNNIVCNGCKAKLDNIKKKFKNFRISVSQIKSILPEPEWGFPKGHINKREGYESELSCAKREFEEETLKSETKLNFITNDPVMERMIGKDKKVYYNKYFVAKWEGDYKIEKIPDTLEINGMKWITKEDIDKYFIPLSEERKKIIDKAYKLYISLK